MRLQKLKRLKILRKPIIIIISRLFIPSLKRLENVKKDLEKFDEIITIYEDLKKDLKSLNLDDKINKDKDLDKVYTKIFNKYKSIDEISIYVDLAYEILSQKKADKDIIIALLLAKKIDEKQRKPTIKHEIKKQVEKVISEIELTQETDDENAYKLARYYKSYKEKGKIHHKEKYVESNFNDLISNFLKNYTVNLYPQFLFYKKEEEIEEYKEMKDSLATLIRRGKLSTENISNEWFDNRIKRIKKEIEEEKENYDAYILIGWKLLKSENEAFKRLKKEFPYVLWSKNTVAIERTNETKLYVHFHIIFTRQNYSGPKEIYQKRISDILQNEEEWDRKAFLSIIPVKTGELWIKPKKEKLVEINEDWSKQKIENYLKHSEKISGHSKEIAINLTVEEFMKEVKVEELLKVIPINIFLQNPKTNEKNLLIESFMDLKNEFDVQNIFDWGDVNKEELSESLIKKDKESKKDERIAEDNRWKDIADSIVYEANKYSDYTTK